MGHREKSRFYRLKFARSARECPNLPDGNCSGFGAGGDFISVSVWNGLNSPNPQGYIDWTNWQNIRGCRIQASRIYFVHLPPFPRFNDVCRREKQNPQPQHCMGGVGVQEYVAFSRRLWVRGDEFRTLRCVMSCDC